jgi:hypothetical protein
LGGLFCSSFFLNLNHVLHKLNATSSLNVIFAVSRDFRPSLYFSKHLQYIWAPDTLGKAFSNMDSYSPRYSNIKLPNLWSSVSVPPLTTGHVVSGINENGHHLSAVSVTSPPPTLNVLLCQRHRGFSFANFLKRFFFKKQ